ncbi:MAG TPA: pyridoxine 5'-phosphate synthase [Candidatus Binatia bacterium]|nr:pyridoxine 5'-phosphate synthase [Candidatus Binatia bacterium]
MSKRVRLGVNIDHVATIRNARGVAYPDPMRAAIVALEAGADGVTAHLREDRRHISDSDIERLSAMLRERGRPLNLEMAVTSEMLDIALKHRPPAVCLVPERREERTTEGGLDVAHGHNWIAPFVAKLRENGSRVSLFIGADALQIEAASRTGAEVVELHTGAFCDAVRDGDAKEASAILAALSTGATQAASLGLEVHAGHGIDYETVAPIAAIPEVAELNIGHFLVGEAIFVGLEQAVSEMRRRIDAARAPG